MILRMNGQRANVEVYMGQPVNAFDLSPEQQETASLLQRLLGSAIANRYVDFCRLAAGPLCSTFRGRWPLMHCAGTISCFAVP